MEPKTDHRKTYELKAIGFVNSSAHVSQYRTREEWAQHVCTIDILPEFADGAKDLCLFFSTALIIFGIDRLAGVHLVGYPRGDKTRPMRGCFSVSTPARPNHLGVTEVELLRQETLPDGRVSVVVRGLDALNESPIFDIKGEKKTPFGLEEEHRSCEAKKSE